MSRVCAKFDTQLTINLFLTQVTAYIRSIVNSYAQLIRSSTETKQMAVKVEVGIAARSKE